MDSSSSGVKRKLLDEMDGNGIMDKGYSEISKDEKSNQGRGKIKALSDDVINKIAAGEIVVAPVNALKELMENSIDAGATSVDIMVKDGGLKLLQISDNGHGIDFEDLQLLCQRFATSKISKFEDLSSIKSFGFRGEALASISHVAHLTVCTRTKDSDHAWKAFYEDGKLAPPKPGQSEEPQVAAGRIGTQMTIEDLFYNIPTRRRAFRSVNDEYTKILDMVGRYAVHCSGISFSCRKMGDGGSGLSVSGKASCKDRIRQVYGNGIASELIKWGFESKEFKVKAQGWASSANYEGKKTTFLLFINNRAVESVMMKRALEHMYSTFLPKGGHPFIYASLDIEPDRVDVNVHPTKRQVAFLNEEDVFGLVCCEVRQALAQVDTSRAFMTQSLLVQTAATRSTSGVSDSVSTTVHESTPVSMNTSICERQEGKNNSMTPRTPIGRIYDNNMVRTDSRSIKLTSLFSMHEGTSVTEVNKIGDKNESDNLEDGKVIRESLSYGELINDPDWKGIIPLSRYSKGSREFTECQLTSIRELRDAITQAKNDELAELFTGHSFIGVVDTKRRLAAVQSGTKLYLVDYGIVCNELFYQIGLSEFTNFGRLKFKPGLDIQNLLEVAIKNERQLCENMVNDPLNKPDKHSNVLNPSNWETLIKCIQEKLSAYSAMLSEYFSLDIIPDNSRQASSPIRCVGKDGSNESDANGETRVIESDIFRSPGCTVSDTLRSSRNMDFGDSRQNSDPIPDDRENKREMSACDLRLQLTSIPILIRGYMPPLEKLPRFLLRLGARLITNYKNERLCLRSLLIELASFYTPEARTFSDTTNDFPHANDKIETCEGKRLTQCLEQILFPALRSRFIATNALAQKGSIVEVANLRQLYRVFERC